MKTIALLLAACIVTSAQNPGVQITGAIGNHTTRYDPGMMLVPTIATVLTTADTWVQLIHCSSTTTIQLTVTDGQTTGATCGTGPCPMFPSVPISPNAALVDSYGTIGLHMRGGIKWQAASSGVYCQIQGVQ